MFVRELMTASPTCCTPETKLDVVARMMFDNDCGEIPVVDGTKLVGVITDRDITLRAVAPGLKPHLIPARDVMTKAVHTVSADAGLEDALQMMEARRVRRLPVTDDGGRVVGILSQTDLATRITPSQLAELVQVLSNRKQRPVLVTI
jgi:CBS domain-containing protein